MKQLKTYLECGGVSCATPANTMGMGNPGQIDADTLTEPIGSIEKTAKALRQNEKPRKKKHKIKESLFDNDLVTKDVCFGDLYNVDEWGDDMDCEHTLEGLINLQKMNKCFKSSKWKKFIRWFTPSTWKSRQYDYSEIFFAFTHIIMSCSSKEEITTKINEFVNECLAKTDFLHKNQYKIQSDILTSHEDIRMFLIQLISNNYPDERFYCWMTVKKK